MTPTAARAIGHVYKGDRLAATVERVAGGVEFAYVDDYLADPGPAVASTLPVSDHPVRTSAGAVPPFFANLLPEGRRLTALRRAVKTSADDELSLLLAVGGDPVGDVRVLPADEEAAPPVAAPVAVDASWSDVDFRDVLAAAAIDPSALAGVQDKVSGRMITVPLVHEGRAHLLKVNPPEYPQVVQNEAFFLRAAAGLSQSVVDARVVHDSKGVAGLLVERFDRVVRRDGTLGRLPVEDGAQLLGIYPADKYNITFEALADAVASASASRALALRALLEQVAFAWLTGNGDLHAKNVSVVGQSGAWSVAPIYDIPATVPYGDHSLALPVHGRTTGLSRRKLLAMVAELGLPRRAAERAIDTALEAAGSARGNLGDIGFDPRRERDLLRVMKQRAGTLAEPGTPGVEGPGSAE